MKKLKLLLIAILAIGFYSCEDEVEAPGTPYATFESASADIGVEQGAETTKDIIIYTANKASSDRSIGVIIVTDQTTADPASYTVPASVTIPSGSNKGVLTVGLKDVGLDEDKTLVLRLEQTAEVYTGDDIVLSLSQLCPNNGIKLKVNLTFDSWPEEAYWRLSDSDGNIVAASADPAAYGAYAGMSGSASESYCLPSGDYTIEIFDGYGDGGTAYSITADGVPVFGLGGGDYTDYFTADFSI